MTDDLRERVVRLEQENRRWKRFGFGCLLGGLAAALLGADDGPKGTPQECVMARRFALVDANGRERAILEMDETGNPQLLFTNDQGARSIELYGAPSNATPFLRLYRQFGQHPHEEGVRLDNRGLRIRGQNDAQAVELAVNPNGVPRFLINQSTRDDEQSKEEHARETP